MELDLRYTLPSGQTGMGQLLNMSTGGMLFRCDNSLPLGELIDVALNWPFPLENGDALELYIHGIILRSTTSGTAISISKHTFRAAAPQESSPL